MDLGKEKEMSKDGINFEVESMVSLFDGKPVVAIRLGDVAQQLSPEKARMIGIWFIEAAVEAERDSAMMTALSDKMKFDKSESAAFLKTVRDYRK